MNPSIFQLSRLEFRRMDIEVNTDYVPSDKNQFFPQLEFDFNKVKFELATALDYPDDEIDDPRHFTLALKVSVRQAKQNEEIVLPYSVTIEGSAFLHFRGNDDVASRFKFVRNTGYSMLYGAYREYVANFTSRSSHGLWFLPSPNFTKRAEDDASYDVARWEASKAERAKKPSRRKPKKLTEE